MGEGGWVGKVSGVSEQRPHTHWMRDKRIQVEGMFRWKGEEFAQDRSGLRCLWDVPVEGGCRSLDLGNASAKAGWSWRGR